MTVLITLMGPRSRSMEDKHMLFWNQGDFGYVKQEVDSMMALCMPKQKVRMTLESHNAL